MDRQPFLHDFQQRLLDLFRASPAADLERNLKALVNQSFNKLELVTREEFDIQIDLMRELAARVEALEVTALRGGGPGARDGDIPSSSDESRPSAQAGDGSRGGDAGNKARADEAGRGGEFYPGVGGSPGSGRD